MQTLFFDRSGKYTLVEVPNREIQPIIRMYDEPKARQSMTLREFSKQSDDLEYKMPPIREFTRVGSVGGEHRAYGFPQALPELPIYIERP